MWLRKLSSCPITRATKTIAHLELPYFSETHLFVERAGASLPLFVTLLNFNFIGEKMNLPFKRSQLSLCVGLIVSSGYQANAAEDEIEEILVSSALNESLADTVHPVTVLSGFLGADLM